MKVKPYPDLLRREAFQHLGFKRGERGYSRKLFNYAYRAVYGCKPKLIVMGLNNIGYVEHYLTAIGVRFTYPKGTLWRDSSTGKLYIKGDRTWEEIK